MDVGPWQPLEFTYWPAAVGLGFIVAAYGCYEARKASWLIRILAMLGYAWITFAWVQGAGFHTGAQASQWFVLGLAGFPLLVLVGIVLRRANQKTKP